MDFERIKFLSLEELTNKIIKLPFGYPAVFMSKSAAERWRLDKIVSDHDDLIWVDKMDENPTQGTISEILRTIDSLQIDGIIAIGGGSVIDAAKAVSAFKYLKKFNSDSILEAIKEKSYLKDGIDHALPIIAVPSTSGTGSEVTRWATIWDDENNYKYSVDAPWLKPSETWVVPELTKSLPPRMTLSSSLDAACQAAEAYWARATNPLAKELAVRALQIITQNLGLLLKDLDNLELREKLSMGSLLSGLAFSQTRTTACHSISYPLTSMFGVEHGLAASMTLAPVAEINSKAVDLSEMFEIFKPFGGIQKWIDCVCEGILKLRLSEFGVSQSDLGEIIENAFTAGRMDNNPVDLSEKDIMRILLKIF